MDVTSTSSNSDYTSYLYSAVREQGEETVADNSTTESTTENQEPAEAETDTVDISSYAAEITAGASSEQNTLSLLDTKTQSNESNDTEESSEDDSEDSSAAARRGADGEPLSDEEIRYIDELQKTDSEVRRHEQAHVTAARGYARGGARFDFDRGPDGKNYAVGGEVSIDTSKENSPEATVRKMRIVQQAALAPAEPSAQDRQVAAMARQKEFQAQKIISKQQKAEMAAQIAKARQSVSGDEEGSTQTAKSDVQLLQANMIIGSNSANLSLQQKIASQAYGGGTNIASLEATKDPSLIAAKIRAKIDATA